VRREMNKKEIKELLKAYEMQIDLNNKQIVHYATKNIECGKQIKDLRKELGNE
jgi:uncharacterized protein YeeX (DUF496 family)